VKIKRALLLAFVFLLSFFLGQLSYKFEILTSIPDSFVSLFVRDIFYNYEQNSNPLIFEEENVKYPFKFIVYGDSRENSGVQRTMIVKKIIEEKPDFVIHLGDMVTFHDEHQWEIFDAFDGQIINNGIRLFPVLGNHEYRVSRTEIFPKKGDPEVLLKGYFKRFPFLDGRRWYTFIYGNSKFIILDTMVDHSPGSPQYEFLKEEIENGNGKFVFVCMHHPPYTKTRYGKARREEKVLAKMIEELNQKGLKTHIVFTAHKHNYERYLINGINYIVSAGGGAPPYMVNRSEDDFYKEGGPNYHYCRVLISENKGIFEMVRLSKDLSKWEVKDSFEIKLQ